jgi:cytochrome oxidase Cu insertion factor (SCO1/SenC/PrrC family)
MHKDVKASEPGDCPKCGMALRLATKSSADRLESEVAPAGNTASERPAGTTRMSSSRIPDVGVFDQKGARKNFYTDLVKGKTVAINFIFTTCTTICPPLTATFRKVQQDLSARGLDVQLISISVDPATDTSERLSAFAEKFKAGPGWTFVTGDTSNIESLLRALGAAVANKNDHTPMILIGNDAAGFWTRAYGLASPAELVQTLTDAASRK